MIEGENIIMTGASGFVGRSVSKTLARANHLFIVGRKKPADIQCHFIEADLSKGLDTSQLPPAIDAVIHLAAITGSAGEERMAVFNLNTASTVSLLEYAKSAGAKQFVFVSTGSACGYHEDAIQEHCKINLEELDFYSFTKAVSECLVQRYSQFFTTLIIRPFYPYGVGLPKESLIPRFVQKIKAGEPIVTFNNGKHPRLSLIHISDFSEAFLRALELEESTILNITSNEHLSIKEISEAIAELLNKKVHFIDKEDAAVKNRIGSTKKMARLLRLQPKAKFHHAVKEIL